MVTKQQTEQLKIPCPVILDGLRVPLTPTALSTAKWHNWTNKNKTAVVHGKSNFILRDLSSLYYTCCGESKQQWKSYR